MKRPRVDRSRLVRSLFPFPLDVYGVAGVAVLWLLFGPKKRSPPPSSPPTTPASERV
jgi:hypothetical protein